MKVFKSKIFAAITGAFLFFLIAAIMASESNYPKWLPYLNIGGDLTVDDNVRIGTSSTFEKLNVFGNVALGDTTAGNRDIFIYFANDGDYDKEWLSWNDGSNKFNLTDDLVIQGGKNLELTGNVLVTGSGKVGIVTSSPEEELEVDGEIAIVEDAGGNRWRLRIDAATKKLCFDYTSRFDDSYTIRASIDTTGAYTDE
jgi:hypothetical protein